MEWSKHYQWILNLVSVGVHVVDKNGITVFYNETMAKIDGLSRGNVIGRSIFQLYPSLTLETSTLNLALKKGIETVDVLQTYVNIQGKQISTINSTHPLYQGNEIIAAVEIAKDITTIIHMYEQTVQLRKELLASKKAALTMNGRATYYFSDLIGVSASFQQAIALAKKAAKTLSPVMISGATGTGKELIAQSIHNASPRCLQPFIAVNCAAFPKELLEGLLFGTTKGAFTGATNRSGIFEQADGGTLFLDELNSLDFFLQGKLLRVLQDGKIRPIGSDREKETNVRIITALNISPAKAVKERILRSDLYYRLNVVQINLPSLKERQEDIKPLANYFLAKFSQQFNMNVTSFSYEATNVLCQYEWPGNVRELSHAIEAAFNIIEFDQKTIEKKHLPASITEVAHTYTYPKAFASKGKIDLPKLLKSFEKETILNIFKIYDGNISKTAKALGLTRQALQYKLTKYEINK